MSNIKSQPNINCVCDRAEALWIMTYAGSKKSNRQQ